MQIVFKNNAKTSKNVPKALFCVGGVEKDLVFKKALFHVKHTKKQQAKKFYVKQRFCFVPRETKPTKKKKVFN